MLLRIPLYLSNRYPYSDEQFDAFRAAFIAVALGPDAERAFVHHWPGVRAAARQCLFEIETRKQGKKLNTRRPQRGNPNTQRPLRNAIKKGRIRNHLKKHPEDIGLLLRGADRLNLITFLPDRLDYDREIDDLLNLPTGDLEKARQAAINDDSSPWHHERGRPKRGAPLKLAAHLCEVYQQISGDLPTRAYNPDKNLFYGPAIDFLRAGMAPMISNELTESGIGNILRAAKDLTSLRDD